MTAPDTRPWLVMVTGEPGSGKTSLALELSAALRLPFLSRDHVRGGLLATAGLWTDQLHAPPSRADAVERLADLVEAYATAAVSAVVEFVVTPERGAAFRRIQAAARCMVILTTATGATGRAVDRDRADPLLARAEVLAALGYASLEDYLSAPERALVRTQMQTDFDLPLLHVTTEAGYEPPLTEVLDWVIERTRA